MLAVRIANQSLHASPYAQPIVTTFYLTNTITRAHKNLETSCPAATVFIPSLALLYIINSHLLRHA